MREATRRQLAELGLQNLGQLRAAIFARVSKAAGWPEGLRPGHVAILESLSANGPQTRMQLAESVGKTWRGSRASLKSNDPEGTYLGRLITLGLVVNLGRLAKGKGKGGSRCVYDLALTTEKGATA